MKRRSYQWRLGHVRKARSICLHTITVQSRAFEDAGRSLPKPIPYIVFVHSAVISADIGFVDNDIAVGNDIFGGDVGRVLDVDSRDEV
jgi:hypothetical protein